MQSHLIFSLITKSKIVISVIIAVTVLCSCKRERQTVFTDTVYSSESGGSDVTAESKGEISSDEGVSKGEQEPASQGPACDESQEQAGVVCVFVCGAVIREGVYELPENARIIDAVNAAGGYAEDADRTYVNQAEYVYDTQRVEIPTVEEAQELRQKTQTGAEAGISSTDAGQHEGLININTADAAELMKIPGIGESKAERIIEYRQLHGRFGSAEELMNVSGIGTGIFEKMKDYITVK